MLIYVNYQIDIQKMYMLFYVNQLQSGPLPEDFYFYFF
jgi:hypothetical protein